MYHFKHLLKKALTVLLISSSTITIFAQEDTESPFFWIRGADTATHKLPLISTDVNATVSGVVANVEVTQTYVNSGDSVIEATYVFPMSTNSAVHAMQMQIENRLIVAEIKERSEAQHIYEEAIENGQTATLLEQERPNVFQMSLGNILPGDTILVTIEYVELLKPTERKYQFVFPTVVGPRYTENNESWVNTAVEDLFGALATDLNINLQINAGMPLTAQCTSHEAPIEINDMVANCSLATHPEKDFVVEYSLCGNEIETGLLLFEGEEENFFLAMIQPPRPDVEYTTPKREYVFIVDVSGSMNGEPMEISKDVIRNLLNSLTFEDKFNILFFAGGSSKFAENSVPVTQSNISNAMSMIDNIAATGGTRLYPAVQEALAMEGTASFSRTFVILTDGFVSVENETFELIQQNLNNANFFAFGIGSSVNRYIIEGMAYVGQGEPFIVSSYADADATVARFKSYIDRPALTNIQMSYSGVHLYDVEPQSIPDVFADRPVLIFGKYDNETNGSISLSGTYGNSEISETLNFSDYTTQASANEALPYLWARHKIKLISDYGIGLPEGESVRDAVLQLGLDYNLVTKYTSFVAVDYLVRVNEETGDMYLVDAEIEEASENKLKISNTISNTSIIVLYEFSSLSEFCLEIRDVIGNLIERIDGDDITENEYVLDIADYSSGVYFITLRTPDFVLSSNTFVKL